MQKLIEFFNSEDFMPHGHCFLWQPDILWLHVISDAMIASAYYSIPMAMGYFVWKRKDMPFGIVFWLFGAFILLCGTTHLMSIWVLWNPDYAAEGVLKALTGFVSIATFIVTIKLIPHALKIASPEQLSILNQDLRLNILERERAQRDLLRSYNIMENKVEERTAELQLLLTRLAHSNTELDEFAHIVSHDLKEPLRGLHTNAQFLLDDYKGKLGEEGTMRLGRLIHLSDRMHRLIDDLLYFSRLGQTDLAVQDTDLNIVISDIAQMMDVFLKEHNAIITLPEPLPHIVCDKLRITEAFRNLITNAAKYNDKTECRIEIGFLNHIQAPHGVAHDVFYVKDNGIGIAPEFHEDIFRIFKRLNEAEKNEKSTGAGLTFVRKIIHRHGGKIWLDSELSKGTIFYFTLSNGGSHERNP